MNEVIAVLNAGSSSIKFALYESGFSLLFRGQVEQIGLSPRLRVVDVDGTQIEERSWPTQGFDHRAATREILQMTVALKQGAPVAGVGHRVVHGGTKFWEPVRIDSDVIGALTKLAPLAPLHQPHNISPIIEIAEAAPHIPQVACFDTAFHHNQPQLARLFALPRKFTEAGVLRYGFHGLSYEYIVAELKEMAPELLAEKIVIAHLGNGASLCAVDHGRSIASTMGFTAADGLMMGTRCGAIDPGVLIYLMDAYGMDARALEDLIYRQSGLLGVSGISSDMRKLRVATEPAAAEAIALFVYRIVREVGSLSAALEGLDALIFTGGIGENDAAIRADVGRQLCWVGLELDEARNLGGYGRISSDKSLISAWVIPTDEECMVARHTAAVLGSACP